MGRELRRKEAKKNKNRNIKTEAELDTNIHGSTVAKVVIFIAILLLVLYYIVAVFITKEIDISWQDDNSTTETDTSSVSDKILAKNIFNQAEAKYYVYFYDFSDEDATIASAISNNSDLTIYRVDTNSALNQNYVTEDNSNRNVTSISDLKVKTNTLIEVTNDKVTAYYEGSSEIVSFLG